MGILNLLSYALIKNIIYLKDFSHPSFEFRHAHHPKGGLLI
jgi:hypothetical protein